MSDILVLLLTKTVLKTKYVRKNDNMSASSAYQLFHNGVLALARAERQGMRINMEYCEEMSDTLTKKIEVLEKEFYQSKFYRHWEKVKQGKPNIHSGQQLGHFIYNIKKIEPAKFTETGKGSTDEKALENLNLPELKPLLRIRKLAKIRDTYLKAFIREQVNGVLHPSFNLHTVRTFRSSSQNPNFQNIPKRDKEAMDICRKAIYPRAGHQLMEVDFGSLEVRIAACYHHDPTMMKYIKDKRTDMHGDMAEQIFCIDKINKKIPEHAVLRAAAKNGFVFPQFYGDYFKNNALSMGGDWCGLPDGKWKPEQGILLPDGTTIAKHMINNGIKSMDHFIDHIKEIENHFWNVRFPVYRDWKEEWWKSYQKKGYITMFTGFRCSGIMGKNDAINYPIQGAAFHCLLWCFNRLDQLIREDGLKTRLIGQIHDAIVLDVHPNELNLIKHMVKEVTTCELPAHWTWINVPLEIEADLAGVDKSWAEMEFLELS